MYAYFLSIGVRLDAERIVDAALEEGEYPQTYVDTETGVLIEVPSVDSLELFSHHGGSSARYVLIERMRDAERGSAFVAFVDELLNDEPTLAAGLRRTLSRSGHRAAEEQLAGNADGWHGVWQDFLEDEAFAYIHVWLTEHPELEVESVFEGCGTCAVCELVLKGEGDNRKKLEEAFVTEDVMRRVAEQMACYGKRDTEQKEGRREEGA